MKTTLSMAELESQMALELPNRDLMAPVVVVGGGLLNIGIGIGNVDVDIPVTVTDNNVCVNVAVVGVAHCSQAG